MKNQFDELAKGLAQTVTRRAALKRFGVGLAGMALVALGLTSNAKAAQGGNGNKKPPLPGYGEPCDTRKGCQPGLLRCCPTYPPNQQNRYEGTCLSYLECFSGA